MQCPECGRRLTQWGKFWLCEEHGQVEPSDHVVPGDCERRRRHVFLSYGRLDGGELARKLRADLQASPWHHYVWMDESEIEKGAGWEERIEKGIQESEVVAAIVTPHAVRSRSVCRDEVVYALNAERPVVPLLADAAAKLTLLLVRRNWVDLTHSYADGLKALLQALAGDLAALNRPRFDLVSGFAPLDFGPEIARYATGFTGRQWLWAEIDRWLATPYGRALVIVGEPGVGKSAIAATLCAREDVVAIHFCTSAQNSETLDPGRFVASLVGQLQARIPGYAEVLAASKEPERKRGSASAAFRELIVEPLADPAVPRPEGRRLIIIDALDEAVTRGDDNIVEVIVGQAPDLPDWLRIVATSRPEIPVLEHLLDPLRPFVLDAERPENLKDLEDYVASRLGDMEKKGILGSQADSVRVKVVALAIGNFLYARYVLDGLESGAIPPDEVETLAPGIAGFYRDTFARRFRSVAAFRRDMASVLAVLAQTREPVPFAVLARIPGADAVSVNERLRDLAVFLRSSGRGDAKTYLPYHKSLTDWLGDRDAAGAYWVEPRLGRELLAECCWQDYQAGVVEMSAYALKHLPAQLRASGRVEDLARLLSDVAYIVRLKAQKFGTVLDSAEGFPEVAVAWGRGRKLWLVAEPGDEGGSATRIACAVAEQGYLVLQSLAGTDLVADELARTTDLVLLPLSAESLAPGGPGMRALEAARRVPEKPVLTLRLAGAIAMVPETVGLDYADFAGAFDAGMATLLNALRRKIAQSLYLTYDTPETCDLAERLADDLRLHGHPVVLLPPSAEQAVDQDAQRETGISLSDLVVLVLSSADDQLRSGLRTPLAFARALGKPILPVLVGESRPSPVALQGVPCLRFTGTYDGLLDSLLTEVPRAVAVKPVTSRAEPKRPLSPVECCPRTASRIFISHDLRDSKFARQLCSDLVNAGHEVFLASDAIPLGGEHWAESAQKRIQEADVVLAVLGPDASRGDSRCHRDIACALNCGKLVLPLHTGRDIQPHPLLADLHSLDFGAAYDAGLRCLLRAVDAVNRLPGGDRTNTHSCGTAGGRRRRVYISYARTDAVDFATRLAHDVRALGHEVWLDADDIPAGADWETALEKAVASCDTMLAVLTGSACRSGSFCRTEVAYALSAWKPVIPLRASPDARPPLIVARRQSIDFVTDYDAGLGRLAEALEQTAAEPVEPRMPQLEAIDFSPQISRLVEGFVGRKWVAHAVDSVLQEQVRGLLITGSPGCGKSAVAAWLSVRHSAVAAAHFCATSSARTVDPQSFVASLAAQFSVQIRDYAERLAVVRSMDPRPDARAAFVDLVVEPLRKVKTPDRPLLFIVDALDEAASHAGETIVDVLSSHLSSLPPWLHLVATTRCDPTVLSRFTALRVMDLEHAREQHADLLQYAKKQLETPPLAGRYGADAMQTAEAIAERADGSFLYARLVIQSLAEGARVEDALLPADGGLGGYYRRLLGNRFPDPGAFSVQYRHILRAVLVAGGQASVEQITQATGETKEVVLRRLRDLRQLLRPVPGGGEDVVALFHKSLGDWLADRAHSGPYWVGN